MNDSQRMAAREEYFKQYQEMVIALQHVVDEEQEIRSQYKRLIEGNSIKHTRINEELDAMRSVITYMLDHGCDPVEAKLMLDDKLVHLWEKTDYGYNDTSHKAITGNQFAGTVTGPATTTIGTISLPMTDLFKTNYNLKT